MSSRKRQRGTTLLEIMISLALVLVGMLGLFKVLSSAIGGSSTSSKMSQAQMRAVTILENIRHAPVTPTQSVLSCLATTAASSWSACETMCASMLSKPTQDGCIYTTTSFVGNNLGGTPVTGQPVPAKDTLDRSSQLYVLDTSNAPDGQPRSRVTTTGANGAAFEIRVVVGWRDDNTATLPLDHSVIMRGGVAAQ
jgi:Tfp pilus assembly protein PilV